MKTKKYILKGLATCLIAASLSACVDLEPKAMSFLTPENTFVDKAGLETMLRLCRKQMNFEWFGDAFNSGNCETYSLVSGKKLRVIKKASFDDTLITWPNQLLCPLKETV